MKKLLAFLACVVLILATTGIQTVNADVANPPNLRPRDVASATFYAGDPTSPLTTTTTLYTGITYAGGSFRVDMSNVDYWSIADVFVSATTTAISGTGYLTVTPQFSNDWTNWRSAAFQTISQTAIVLAPISWSLTTTGTVGYPIPIQGDFMRFKIDYTSGVTTQVVPLVRVTFKNYGAFQ